MSNLKNDYDKFDIWSLKMKNPEPVFRAYSMANHPAEGNIIMLNIRLATPQWDKSAGRFMNVNPGICSSYVFACKPGDKITISGPFGDFHIKDTKKEMIYIGGGAGMAPLRSHLFHLFHTKKESDRKITFWYGGRSLREVFYTEDFNVSITLPCLNHCRSSQISWRTAEIVFNIFRFKMVFQVVIVKHLVNETNISCPIILRQWFRQGNVILKLGNSCSMALKSSV